MIGTGARPDPASRQVAIELVSRDLVDALVQENLFCVRERLDPDAADGAAIPATDRVPGGTWYRLAVAEGSLLLPLRPAAALQPWRLAAGTVWFVAPGSPARPIGPAEVLERLAAAATSATADAAAGGLRAGDPGDTASLSSVLRDLHAAVEQTAALSRQHCGADCTPRPGALLAGERLAATRGRPFHPTARAVSGWTTADVARYGPMRARPLGLDWVAVRREHLRHGTDPASSAVHDLLLGVEDRQRLADRLRRAGLSAAEFQPLPVHPWQFQHVLRREFAAEFARGDVVELARGLGDFRPTASLRTLAMTPAPGPESTEKSARESALHVKLPLGVATLGATRLLPPRYLDNGDRAQCTMTDLLARDVRLRKLVAVAGESAWAGWADADGGDEFTDRPGHLAAQVRRYPAELVADPALLVLPMAALAAHEWDVLASPLGLSASPGTPRQRERVIEFFGRVADGFCVLALGFLRYGVLPELHGQNVLVACRDGVPERFVLRDHDTLRVCPGWLAAAGVPDPGYRITPGARQSLSLAQPEALVGYLQTLGFQVNLFGIADALARWSGVDESAFWRRLRRSVGTTLDELDLPAQVASVAERVLLGASEWPSRLVLGPLLRQGISSGVSMPAGLGTVPNPLLCGPSALRSSTEGSGTQSSGTESPSHQDGSEGSSTGGASSASPVTVDPHPAAVTPAARDRAERAARQRLLNAFLRETGVHDPRRAPGGTEFRLPLPVSGRMLAGSMPYWSVLGLHGYGDDLTVQDGDHLPPRPVAHRELVELLLAELAARVRGDGAQANGSGTAARRRRLATQIENSVARTAVYLTNAGAARTSAQDGTFGGSGLRTRLAEQSVLFGHPLHPTPKSAEGFGSADIAAYAPELGTDFPLHYIAVAPELVRERRIAPGGWLPPGVTAAVAQALSAAQRDFQPLPGHPWQVEYLLRQEATLGLVRAGALVPLGPVGPRVYPTSSVRTVCDPRFATCWKLPLHVRITNFVRNNPPEHVHRALDAGAVISALGVGTDATSAFRILVETGAHAVAHPDLGADFSVLYRDNPFAAEGGSPLVLAGLLDEGVCGGEPALIRAVRQAVGVPAGGLPLYAVAEWLRRYLSISLLPLLDLFARHGVSLEAHVQNSLVELDSGWPSRFFVRDMEGTSISRARVRATVTSGLADDSPVYYSDAEAWQRLQYYAVTNHLGHLLHVLGRFGNVAERALWTVVAEVLGGLADNPYAAALRTAPTLPAKANLISRFAERDEHPTYSGVPNPIREDLR